MLAPGRGGLSGTVREPSQFAPASEQWQGNNLPPWTGSTSGPPARPAPGPHAGGQVGHYDGASGADPSRPDVEPWPPSSWRGASGESDRGDLGGPAGPPLGYAGGAPRVRGPEQSGFSGRLGYQGDPLSHGRPSYWRGGIQGFNDQQQVRDRHAYFDSGTQRTGLQPSVPGTPPNYHSDGPARPDLRVVNRSVNPQIGSDASRNQDDRSRPYTWLGQQDGTTSPVYGGVPGLWVPYGTRGGIPYPIHSPQQEGSPLDGPAMVWSGPPHGLHSDTIQSGRQIVERYLSTAQMRPVRVDRPANSPIAGQSYSQTLPMQGQPGSGQPTKRGPGAGLSFNVSGRGWLGG
jgi:hypothetical protein